MAAANVFVPVTNPDDLIAGTSPYASFVAAKIQLYRYSSEDNARDDTSGTLITTFTLVASTTAAADPNISGPYRFGYYDSGQTTSSWYRYRFADTGLANFSPLSEPWRENESPQTTLRDVLYEAGKLLGETVEKATATGGSTTTAVLPTLLKSTKRDAHIYEGWWAFVSQDGGGLGAAPEGEEAMVDTVATDTGTATLDAALTTAIASGDVVLLSGLIRVTRMIEILNLVRERMQFTATHEIALTSDQNRYPAPYGVKSETDVLDGVGVMSYVNSHREDLFELDYRVVFDGARGWIEIGEYPGRANVARFTVLRSYRDAEGELSELSDTTVAPIEWLRPALAYGVASELVEADENDPEAQRLLSRLELLATQASGRFAPEITRKARSGYGRKLVPGPAWCP